MIRSKMRMGILLGILALALQLWPGVVGPAQGQGSRKDDIVFNTRGVPLAGATVRVCAMPASGQPCTPLALIYSDPRLTQALANPTNTDGMGNYSFYAAPGKYEIEISGPGITTKQLPNVILPSDPSSPTFSSISSTGGISAFTLNLTGNLTVNGSTAVVGNLSSGTLSLANQGTAPGTPSAGSVNLYTKTADKRLYYKDETGVEVGPIASGSGAQTNTPNTFTAPQNIDADFHTKGPNPWYDLGRFGWYSSATYYNTGTTGTMSASSASLTLASALDFQNGQGILIIGAGPAPTIATPTSVTAAPLGATGSTTYYYCVVDEDFEDGRTACSAAGSVANAVAVLGIQTNTLTACNRSSGVVTCTTSANHNFINGSQIEIQGGTTGDSSFEGAFTLTTASGSTFTYNQYGAPDTSGTVTHGNARVVGKVAVKWQAPSNYTVLKHLVYRCTGGSCSLPANAGNYNLVGVATGQDSYFVDQGYTFNTGSLDNGDAPQTAPTTTSNQWLSTTITAGGGTTSLTLAASSANAVSSVLVKHDNTPVIKAACASLTANAGPPTLYVPAVGGAGWSYSPISSTLSLTSASMSDGHGATCPGGTQVFFNNTLYFSAPLILGMGNHLSGGPGGSTQSATAYLGQPYTVINGTAYPLIYENSAGSHDDTMTGFKLVCAQPYQVCLYGDQDVTGSGATDFSFTDVTLAANGASNAYVQKSGFGYFWVRGGWESSVTDFSSPTAALFSGNCGTGQSVTSLPGIGYTTYMNVFGGMLVDSCGTYPSGFAHWTFNELLAESSYVPMLRVNTYYGVYNTDMYNLSYADYLGGASTPLIDLTNIGSFNAGLRIFNGSCATSSQPLFETSGATLNGLVVTNPQGGCNIYGANYGAVRNPAAAIDDYLNWNQRLQSTSHIAYQMSVPLAPASAVAGSGGTVAVGAHTYYLSAVDADGNETTIGPGITATTTSGNQAVTITAPASFPPGAVGLNVYRDNGRIYNNSANCNTPNISSPGGTQIDSYSALCTSNTPYSNQAGSSLLSSGGVATYKIRIGSEALTALPRGEQNIFLPGALTTTWTGSTWTPDKAVTVTRLQVQAKTGPSGCTTNAVVRLTDGANPVNVTISAAANDSGSIAQNYAAGTPLTLSVQTAAAGCTTSPADANVTIQYRMQ
jgi:hypothetical protein